MNEEGERPRGVREETSFAQQKAIVIEAIGITAQQFEEAYIQPIDLLIAIDPTIYPAIEGSDLRGIVTRNLAQFPSLRIAYSFDDDLIHLWYVDLNPANDDGQDG
jgi:hypothetical protein